MADIFWAAIWARLGWEMVPILFMIGAFLAVIICAFSYALYLDVRRRVMRLLHGR
jgi:hypothetical protein